MQMYVIFIYAHMHWHMCVLRTSFICTGVYTPRMQTWLYGSSELIAVSKQIATISVTIVHGSGARGLITKQPNTTVSEALSEP